MPLPPNGPPKINFLNRSSSGISFFDISRYLRDKYLDGCTTPLGTSICPPPQINSHYLICVGRSKGLLLSKVSSSFMLMFFIRSWWETKSLAAMVSRMPGLAKCIALGSFGFAVMDCCFQVLVFSGSSMEPTIHDRDVGFGMKIFSHQNLRRYLILVAWPKGKRRCFYAYPDCMICVQPAPWPRCCVSG